MKLFLKFRGSCVIYVIAILVTSCNKSVTTSKYRSCDSNLAKFCDGKGNGEYCTFGIKWGPNNPFSNAGLEKPGPQSGGITLVYKFMDAGFKFSSHSDEDLVSLPFDNNSPDCIIDKFKLAFGEWSSKINVDFREVLPNETADIKIIMADLTSQSSFGYGNFVGSPCAEIKGLIVFKRNEYNCSSVYGAVLHEIGHVLGLGHVTSNNIMHPSRSTSFTSLQNGDIKGAQSIYGAR